MDAALEPYNPVAPFSSAGQAPAMALSSNQTEVPAAAAAKYAHGFGWEHRGWDAGAMGGLAMMGIAVVWFFGGLAFDVIFYYPVILFIIGVVGFIRGLFTGNLAGKEYPRNK